MSTSGDELVPPIGDGNGYNTRERDLKFLAIDGDQIVAWRERDYPLGQSEITFTAFREKLAEALLKDGLSIAGCDVRLKGSAAEFYSGPHKPMPRSDKDLVRWFFLLRERTPEDWELQEIKNRLNEKWLTDGLGPSRRPFDVMFRLGIDQYPSDFDVQISSDELVERCKEILEDEAHGVEELTVANPHYGFVRHHLVAKAAPSLYQFGLYMSDCLDGRNVGIAVFPSSGPPEAPDEPISSHFQETDWRIDIREPNGEGPIS
ncbi:MAG: hypothetical protein JHC98_05955 [Thermoleophilaceae bacterium]|nr:hypothetical protein [Thermoleophilaceae bacterium]